MSAVAGSEEGARERSRAWQLEQTRRTLADIDAGVPGHGEVSEADIDAVFDRRYAELDQTDGSDTALTI